MTMKASPPERPGQVDPPAGPSYPPELDLRQVIRRGLIVGLGWMAVLLVLSLALVKTVVGHLERLTGLWMEASPLPLLASMFLLFGGVFFMGFRWRALLPGGRDTSPLVIMAICTAAHLLNLALPGPVGELAGAGLVERRYGIPAPVALAASVHARFMGVLAAALLALASWFVTPMEVPANFKAMLLATLVAVVLMAGFLVAMAAWPRAAAQLSSRTIGRLAALPLGPISRLLERLDVMVAGFGEALSGIGRRFGRPHLAAAAWAFVGVLTVALAMWLGLRSLGVDGSYWGILFSHCVATGGSVLLFAVPVGQMGWDAAFTALLIAAVGLDLEVALSITVMVRFQQMLAMGIGAVVLGYELSAGRRHGGAGGVRTG